MADSDKNQNEARPTDKQEASDKQQERDKQLADSKEEDYGKMMREKLKKRAEKRNIRY